MTTLANRIKKLRTEKKLTQAELGNLIGVHKSSVSQWENGLTKKMDGENLVRTAKALGVTPEWLSTGKGEKQIMQTLHEHENYISLSESRNYIPLISWVSAGNWCEAIDNFSPGDAEEWLPCPVTHGEHTYALRVKGDSMTSPYAGQRSYNEGTIIFVDPSRQITNGCRVIAKLPESNEVTFKEYREDGGKYYLKPLNPQYSLQEINADTHICGVVIGQFQSE